MPGDAPPAYSELDPLPEHLSGATTKKIPSPINFYAGLTKFWLGRHQEEKLFAASFGWGMFGRTCMTLYDGQTTHAPVLITSRHQHGKYILTIPESHNSVSVKSGKPKGEGEDIVLENSKWKNPKSFSIEVGDGTAEKPHVEQFEWRQTRGEELKLLSGSKGNEGWKLVRLGRQVAQGESSADGSKRAFGVTSDGLEVVAVCAHKIAVSMKGAYFCFMNSGLDGSMGERWELAAVLSGLILWYISAQAMAAAGIP